MHPIANAKKQLSKRGRASGRGAGTGRQAVFWLDRRVSTQVVRLTGQYPPDPPAPRLLYHYTSGVGLQGILESRKIWASNCAYLNDTQEYHHVFNVLSQMTSQSAPRRVGRHPAMRRGAKSIEEFSSRLHAMLDDVLADKVSAFYVASLTVSGDDLSQWRGYTSPEDGYSIGFSTDMLRTSLGVEGWSLRPVRYGTNVAEFVYSRLSEAIAACERIPARGVSFAEQLLGELRKEAPFCKDGSFEAEQEWRVAKELPTTTESKFRPGSFSLVPYHEVPLGADRQAFSGVHVICGPGRYQDLALRALSSYASPRLNVVSHGVSPSSAPYRG